MVLDGSKVAVVVGASRGIGFALAKRLSEKGHEVFATCRTTNDDIDSISAQCSNFHTVSGVDVAVDGGCDALAALPPARVDTVFLNAGIMGQDALETLDFGSMAQQFNVNAMGPLRAVQALLPRLVDGSKVVLIGSKLGSFEGGSRGGRYGYRMSKAAAHMAAWTLAADVKERGVAVAVIHPGVVETDMTKASGSKTEVTAVQSAACMVDLLPKLKRVAMRTHKTAPISTRHIGQAASCDIAHLRRGCETLFTTGKIEKDDDPQKYIHLNA